MNSELTYSKTRLILLDEGALIVRPEEESGLRTLGSVGVLLSLLGLLSGLSSSLLRRHLVNIQQVVPYCAGGGVLMKTPAQGRESPVMSDKKSQTTHEIEISCPSSLTQIWASQNRLPTCSSGSSSCPVKMSSL